MIRQLRVHTAFIGLIVLAACTSKPAPTPKVSDGGSAEAGSAVKDAQVDAHVTSCNENADCDDGAYCTGEETCVNHACLAGTPVTCDDGIPCTNDVCVEAARECRSLPP